MNKFTLKATTALASALVISPLALAIPTQAADISLGANEEWADTDSSETATDAGDAAAAGDNVNFTADVTLTVTNDGNNNDGSGKNTFELGAVTATNTGEGTIAIQAENDPAIHDGNLIATIDSVGTDADNTVKALTVTGGRGGASVLGNTANATVVDTAAAYIDTVTVTGGAGAANVDQNGGAASVTIQGALVGDLNITGGAGADTDNLTDDGGNGGSATATVFAGVTGDIRLTHGADGKDDDTTNALKAGTGNSATLSIGNGAGFTPAGGSSANPAVAQAITGSITAAADGDGTIVVNNAVGGTSAGVEITGNVGSTSTVTDGTLQVNDTLTLEQSSTDIAISGHTKLVLGMTSGTAITAAENTEGSIVDLNSDNAAVDSLTFVAANGMKPGNEVIIFTADVVAERVDSALPNHIVTHITNGTGGDVASSNLADFNIAIDTDGNIVLTATSRATADIAANFGLSESESERFLTAFNNSTNSAFADFVGGLTDDQQVALIADQVAVQE